MVYLFPGTFTQPPVISTHNSPQASWKLFLKNSNLNNSHLSSLVKGKANGINSASRNKETEREVLLSLLNCLLFLLLLKEAADGIFLFLPHRNQEWS